MLNCRQYALHLGPSADAFLRIFRTGTFEEIIGQVLFIMKKSLKLDWSNVKWSHLGQIIKILRNSRTNFKVSSKKRNLILLYTHFEKFIIMKKNHTNKKTYILIPMIPLYFIILKRNKQ